MEFLAASCWRNGKQKRSGFVPHSERKVLFGCECGHAEPMRPIQIALAWFNRLLLSRHLHLLTQAVTESQAESNWSEFSATTRAQLPNGTGSWFREKSIAKHYRPSPARFRRTRDGGYRRTATTLVGELIHPKPPSRFIIQLSWSKKKDWGE